MCLNYACAYAILRNTNADCRKQTVAVAKKVHTYLLLYVYNIGTFCIPIAVSVATIRTT